MFQASVNGSALNMSIVAGDTVASQVTFSSGGVAMNLTGYSAKMRIGFQSPVDLNAGNGGITIPTPTGGIIQINITSTASAAFTAGQYPYDLWLVSGSGAETAYLGGTFTVKQNISPVP